MTKLAVDLKFYDTTVGSLKGFGALGLDNPRNPLEAPAIFMTFISSTIGLITLIGLIWFIINFVIGAVSIITSGGDKQALESAKKRMSHSLIGFVIMIFALILVGAVTSLMGLPNMFDFMTMFNLLVIK